MCRTPATVRDGSLEASRTPQSPLVILALRPSCERHLRRRLDSVGAVRSTVISSQGVTTANGARVPESPRATDLELVNAVVTRRLHTHRRARRSTTAS